MDDRSPGGVSEITVPEQSAHCESGPGAKSQRAGSGQ